MEKKRAHAGSPLEVAGVTIVPVTEASLSSRQWRNSVAFFCRAHPVSVVVVSPSGKRAIGMDGEEVSLDSLLQEVPGLKETLDKI
ncbi:MAG: hypothetical protein HYX79_08990 [Chloroflexi bacterium]|nr:hypothetical protein [Chloroflexota bacterium]